METIVTLGGSPSALSFRMSALLSLAADAGAAILSIYHGDSSSWDVATKSDASPLTAADRAANDVICAGLERMTPGVPIMSEENRQLEFEVRRKWEYYWCVDPLDGTKEFIKRNGDFTVNIALMHRPPGHPFSHPIAGVVHTPVESISHFAVQNHGAYRIPASSPNSEATPIAAASFRMTDPGLVVVCSRSHADARTEAFLAKMEAPKTAARGSSLKFLMVAEGEAAVYPRLAPTSEWDTAAAQIVVEEAGGEVLVWEGEGRLSYGKEDVLNPYFVCYGKRLD